MDEKLKQARHEALEGMGKRMAEKRTKDYEEAGLCPKCGANVKYWQEVFGEEHKCK